MKFKKKTILDLYLRYMEDKKLLICKLLYIFNKIKS